MLVVGTVEGHYFSFVVIYLLEWVGRWERLCNTAVSINP
jgi:hypothetical protein